MLYGVTFSMSNEAMSDNFVLVAPRPLRVNSLTASQRQVARVVSPPADAFARIKLADDDEVPESDASPPSGRSSASPR